MVKSILVLWLIASLSFGASSAQGKKKVLILGAGVSGITAAKTLYDRGVTDFLVLEGQSDIGGPRHKTGVVRRNKSGNGSELDSP